MPDNQSGQLRFRRLARATVGLVATAALVYPAAAGAHSAQRMTAMPTSVPRTSNVTTGKLANIPMSIEVVLKPSHNAALNRLLTALYKPGSASYQHWLAKGQFVARFAPSASERSAVAAYLRSQGLRVVPSTSPFFVRATGHATRVASAFSTSLRTYRDRRGLRYYSNASAVRLPSGLARGVLSVVGLSNTVRERDHAVPIHENALRRPASASGSSTSCTESSYPTLSQFIDVYENGAPVNYGWGNSPGCNGLSPSQTDGLYGAPSVGSRGQGAGTTMAVFELSAYRASDITTWAQTFYGRSYRPPLVNINADGGPANPVCPSGDTCLPASEAYSGDIEVDADIEQTLAVAPKVAHLEVYNAPNDYTGQTELDEYSLIAQQDTAETISSSWGICENDAGAAYAEAENQLFEQMAAQGQSMFSSAGDTGAFTCIRDGTGDMVNVGDPSSQPYVTSVGGTSFNNDNPGTNPNPSYPAPGTESVWNAYDLCSEAANTDGESGYWWCTNLGAGGGGVSQFWGQPSYQTGPGVINAYTEYANAKKGTCVLAARKKPCREVPDVSANADPWTGYAEYCTGEASQGSVCATITGNVPGWFAIGGTSLSSPLWSAVIGDRDGYKGRRTGLANTLLYSLFNRSNAAAYFHDITGSRQAANNNGLFPVTRGYDMATGIGTPNMRAIITGS